MENKLTEITGRLFEEGLAKGRARGEELVREAEVRAAQLVKEAEERAGAIVKKAEAEAEELRSNTLTEVALAGREAVARIKEELTGLIVVKSLGDGAHKATIDPAFVRDFLLEIARHWNGGAGKVTLEALLPAASREKFDAEFANVVGTLLAAGIEVGYSDAVKSGFKVGEKGGGYYIGFSDENFEALLGGYLRERAKVILYK